MLTLTLLEQPCEGPLVLEQRPSLSDLALFIERVEQLDGVLACLIQMGCTYSNKALVNLRFQLYV